MQVLVKQLAITTYVKFIQKIRIKLIDFLKNQSY